MLTVARAPLPHVAARGQPLRRRELILPRILQALNLLHLQLLDPGPGASPPVENLSKPMKTVKILLTLLMKSKCVANEHQ